MKNFKICLIATFLLSGIILVNGQENKEPRYLLGNETGEIRVSGFGSYILGFSQVDGNLAVYNGGGGGVLLNQTVYFGGYGVGLSTQPHMESLTLIDHFDEQITYEDLYTEFGHGGFWIGYLHQSYKPVHFGASTKLGWGNIGMTNDYFDDKHDDFHDFDNYDHHRIVNDNVFVVTPQVELEMNLLRWFKINMSAGYQFVTGTDKTYKNINGDKVKFFDSKDFSQPMFNVTFAFGGFGDKR